MSNTDPTKPFHFWFQKVYVPMNSYAVIKFASALSEQNSFLRVVVGGNYVHFKNIFIKASFSCGNLNFILAYATFIMYMMFC
jgi:hypothetical protein